MKTLKLFLLSILSIQIIGSTFAYRELIIRNYDDIATRVIKVVLDGQDFVVSSLAMDGGDTLENLTRQVGGNTSINGVFFCPDDYSQCDITHTISERVFLGEGEAYSRYRGDTGIRAIFGFEKNGDPLFVQNNLGYMTGLDLNFNSDKIDDLYFGLGNFPVLLYNGENMLSESEIEMDAKIRNAGSKQFICSTEDEKTIYMGVVAGLNIYKFTDFIAKNFDCHNALLLDAGLSAGMVYEGNVIARGTRTRIMDAFVVLTREEYQNLTNYNPPYKPVYQPENTYTLNATELKGISAFESYLRKEISKRGSDYRREIIKILRKIISSPNFQALDIQAKIHELLLRLYTIDKL